MYVFWNVRKWLELSAWGGGEQCKMAVYLGSYSIFKTKF